MELEQHTSSCGKPRTRILNKLDGKYREKSYLVVLHFVHADLKGASMKNSHLNQVRIANGRRSTAVRKHLGMVPCTKEGKRIWRN